MKEIQTIKTIFCDFCPAYGIKNRKMGFQESKKTVEAQHNRSRLAIFAIKKHRCGIFMRSTHRKKSRPILYLTQSGFLQFPQLVEIFFASEKTVLKKRALTL